ncbi:MAG TPA: hypothetical protein VM142_00620 [Acidimicrobiales bacterium]|nr:hypothetical protein [Acidimicrobiales bacterium]
MSKKLILVLIGMLSILLGVQSVAWACTRFVGSFNVTGNDPTSGTVTSKGLDISQGNGQQALYGGFAKAKAVLGAVTISTARSGAVPANTFGGGAAVPTGQKLPKGVYNVIFLPGPVYTSHYNDIGTTQGPNGINYDGDGSETFGANFSAFGDWQYGQVSISPSCYQASPLGGSLPPQVTIGGNPVPGDPNGGGGVGIPLGSVQIDINGEISDVVSQLTVGGTPVGSATTPTFGLPPTGPSVDIPVWNPAGGPLDGYVIGYPTPNYVEEAGLCLSSAVTNVNPNIGGVPTFDGGPNGAAYAQMAPVTVTSPI